VRFCLADIVKFQSNVIAGSGATGQSCFSDPLQQQRLLSTAADLHDSFLNFYDVIRLSFAEWHSTAMVWENKKGGSSRPAVFKGLLLSTKSRENQGKVCGNIKK
jgi:hypothetical protein